MFTTMFFKSLLYCHHVCQCYLQSGQTRIDVKTSAKTEKKEKKKKNTSVLDSADSVIDIL